MFHNVPKLDFPSVAPPPLSFIWRFPAEAKVRKKKKLMKTKRNE